jgi:hypothetical protein
MEKTQNPVKVLYANKSLHGMDNSIVVLGEKWDSNPNTKLDWFQVFELNLGNQWNPEIHSEEEVADKLFQILNMDSNPLGTPEKQEMIKSLGLSHTSMSIGDMVEFPNGKKLVCVSEGWEEMRGNLFLTEAEAFTN